MEYSKLVAVTGLPGLFELINSKTDGAIVRSLEDKSTRFISNRIHHFSQLESIEVFTVNDNVNLAEIFFAMEKAGGLPDVKDEAAVRKYFEKTYPDLDFERVYISDLKKMVKWFDVLKNKNIEIKLPEVPEEPEEEEVVEIEEKPAEKKKPAPGTEKKPAPKPAGAKESTKENKSKAADKEDKKSAKPAKSAASASAKKPAAKSGSKSSSGNKSTGSGKSASSKGKKK